MRGAGVLEDLGFTTVGEAIIALTSMVEAQKSTIEQLQKPETIEDINKELGIE